MRSAKSLLLASTLLAMGAAAARADINVVASVKPVHSLVAAVMEGVGTPGLIVEGAGSPHTYALKPSQAKMLQSADLVFWIGEELETFLQKPLDSIAANAKSVELIDAHDLMKLRFREGGTFEDHHHGEAHAEGEGHDHEEMAEDSHDEHDHEETGEAGHENQTGEFDAHVWLDPVNARVMVQDIVEALVAADLENAARYEANAETVSSRLDALIAEITTELDPVKEVGFIVFHDAYQYFESRFGVTASGSITVSPEVMPGAERVSEIRARLQELGVACVFAEPQFEPKLISTVTEGTQARSAVLDPLGSELENGPDLYFQLIRNMATSFKTCLSEAS